MYFIAPHILYYIFHIRKTKLKFSHDEVGEHMENLCELHGEGQTHASESFDLCYLGRFNVASSFLFSCENSHIQDSLERLHDRNTSFEQSDRRESRVKSILIIHINMIVRDDIAMLGSERRELKHTQKNVWMDHKKVEIFICFHFQTDFFRASLLFLSRPQLSQFNIGGEKTVFRQA